MTAIITASGVSKTFRQAKRWYTRLGLPERDVVDLGRVGLLPSRLDPDAEEDETPPSWCKQDLDRCYNRVLAYASVGGDRHLTGLAEAAQVLAAVGLRAVDILQEVVTGELWCAACSPSAALADLVFLSMDIAARLKAPPSGRGASVWSQ